MAAAGTEGSREDEETGVEDESGVMEEAAVAIVEVAVGSEVCESLCGL